MKILKTACSKKIADAINECFEKGTDLAMGQGTLIPLPKPGKSPIAANFRPIILLNTLRKVYANVVLNRIQPDVEEYLPDSQTAYRKGHSTAENVWAMKYYSAACQHFDTTYDTLALDMSKAFDSMEAAESNGGGSRK